MVAKKLRKPARSKGAKTAHFAKKLRKPARSKGAKTAHLLRACFCNFRKPFLFRYIIFSPQRRGDKKKCKKLAKPDFHSRLFFSQRLCGSIKKIVAVNDSRQSSAVSLNFGANHLP
jgi:hypothetical protein